LYKMSLCASTVAGHPEDNYFVAVANGVLEAPEVVPLPGAPSASLEINNGLPAANPNTSKVAHFVTATSGGGLTAGHYQAFLYSPQVGGSGIAQVFDVAGNGNNEALLACNFGRPLDPNRIGTFTGTGAPLVVACVSISAGSSVQCSFQGGALPAAAPVITLQAGVSFTVTADLGSIFQYVVFG
jgi:hypothetical protein